MIPSSNFTLVSFIDYFSFISIFFLQDDHILLYLRLLLLSFSYQLPILKSWKACLVFIVMFSSYLFGNKFFYYMRHGVRQVLRRGQCHRTFYYGYVEKDGLDMNLQRNQVTLQLHQHASLIHMPIKKKYFISMQY